MGRHWLLRDAPDSRAPDDRASDVIVGVLLGMFIGAVLWLPVVRVGEFLLGRI